MIKTMGFSTSCVPACSGARCKKQSVSATAAIHNNSVSADFQLQQGGFMYLLFVPAMAGVLVIGFIQLRDQFSTLR
jgi:hypothetical protein